MRRDASQTHQCAPIATYHRAGNVIQIPVGRPNKTLKDKLMCHFIHILHKKKTFSIVRKEPLTKLYDARGDSICTATESTGITVICRKCRFITTTWAQFRLGVYEYFVTVLKSIFQVSVFCLCMCMCLATFYFYSLYLYTRI